MMIENPYIPKDWQWRKLIETSKIILGQSPSSDTYNTDNEGLPFYQGKAEFGALYPTPVKWCSAPKKIAQSGDILISVRAPVGPTNICQEKSCIGRGLAAIRTKEDVYNKYVFYYLRSIQDKWDKKSTGTTFKAITGAVLHNQEIPIPPFGEQREIVQKIEELFSQLDAGVAGLKRAQVKLKRYRVSVLKAAFEGRLVPQDPNDEPILKSLYIESQQVLDKEKYKPIPEKWEWLRLVNCVDILDRKRIPVNSKEREKRISGKDETELYPYYGATGHVGWIDDYIFDEELILLGEDGAPFIDIDKEKAYIVKGKFWVNNHAHVIRAKDKLTTNRFILHYLNFFNYKDFVTGTTRLKLNQTKMKQIPVIIPPLNEQKRIVEEIDRRLSIVNEIEKSIDFGFMKSDHLRNAILKSAFEGQLINTDPSIFLSAKDTKKQGNLFND